MAPVNTVYWNAEVFTLGTGTCRSISMNIHLPHILKRFSDNKVVVDGVIHWVACDLDTRSNNVIVSFDLTSEEFGTVDLPDGLAQCRALSIFERKGSLVVIKYHMDTPICEVWAMIKNGDSKSLFTKLFDVTFKGTYDTLSEEILGFRKNGELMTEHIYRYDGVVRTILEGSEPGLEHGEVIEMDVAYKAIPWMASYTESLLLLNHSDSIAM
ncbi:uncharacterized protein LOC143606875 [Bidens hawaiensis]|uniref:uncharacterized protein LOC143606875 n=1 Tax=Bidens hawaiensis TaxID=980011 RepID=UPI0040494E38